MTVSWHITSAEPARKLREGPLLSHSSRGLCRRKRARRMNGVSSFDVIITEQLRQASFIFLKEVHLLRSSGDWKTNQQGPLSRAHGG